MNRTISEALYGLQQKQKDITFFDRCTGKDVLAFFDFALILKNAQKGDKFAISLRNNVKIYLAEVSKAINNDNKTQVKKLLNGLGETKHTGLGYADRDKDGTGVRGKKGDILFNGLNDFRKITQKGNTSFFIIPFALNNICNDGASDILTAILKADLINFTQELAKVNNWETTKVLIKNVFNFETLKWENKKLDLPVADGNPLILFPKQFINNNSRLNSIFNSFKSYLFVKYIKYDKKYKSYWTENKQYISYKTFKKILSDENTKYKPIIRNYLNANFAILDDFENELMDVESLTDEELEMLQTCRIIQLAA